MSDENASLVALFGLIESVLQGECGDGDAHVHCKYRDKEEVARLFEAWHSALPHARLRRVPAPGGEQVTSPVILFSDMRNENVTFSNAQDELPTPSWCSLVVTM
jgi:hypothetical protein